MTKDKLCPVMAMASAISRETYSPLCVKVNCAWWDWEIDECFVKSISFNIEGIRDDMENERL